MRRCGRLQFAPLARLLFLRQLPSATKHTVLSPWNWREPDCEFLQGVLLEDARANYLCHFFRSFAELHPVPSESEPTLTCGLSTAIHRVGGPGRIISSLPIDETNEVKASSGSVC